MVLLLLLVSYDLGLLGLSISHRFPGVIVGGVEQILCWVLLINLQRL